jgi:hypothetical protein
MDLSMLRQVAKGRYGLDRSSGEDSLFTNPVLNDLINEKHRWFASVALCYYRPDYYTPFVVGQSAYAADAAVIEIDPKTVRIQTAAGTFARLPLRLYPSLLDERGILEALPTSTPTAFWMRAGGENDRSRIIELVPAPNTLTAGAGTTVGADIVSATDPKITVVSSAAISRGLQLIVGAEKMLVQHVKSATEVVVVRGHNGTPALTSSTASHTAATGTVKWDLHNLIYGAWVYPSELIADSDRPALDSSEHDRLIPAICWGMAELERSRGRGDAPVEYWQAQAADKALELFEVIRRGTREAPRTAQVGASPLDDARERRQAKLGPLSRRME